MIPHKNIKIYAPTLSKNPIIDFLHPASNGPLLKSCPIVRILKKWNKWILIFEHTKKLKQK
jgi:hypothetical protein